MVRTRVRHRSGVAVVVTTHRNNHGIGGTGLA